MPIDYVRVLAEQVRSSGVDVDVWLRRSGMSEAELHQPERRVSLPVFRQVVHDALMVTGEPALGLFVGRRLVASTHGVVGFAATKSSTLGQALEVLEQFSRLRTSLIAIRHDVGPRKGRIIFSEAVALGDIRRPVLEAVVLSIKTVLDEITLGACQVREVAFPFDEPEYAALARDLFGCPVRYRQKWAGFAAGPDALDLPLKLADPDAFAEAALICQRELARLCEGESFAVRVRRLLLETQRGFPSLQVAARLFHLTPRTFHRRLVDEGTSYRELLDSVRHGLAVQQLRSGRFSLTEIAYRLGYTDLANFRRAFKRWESVPPSEYQDAPPPIASRTESH